MLSHFKRMTLGAKLMLLAMITSVVAMLIVSAAVYFFNSITGYNQFYTDLKVISKVVAHRSAAAISFNDVKLAEENLQVLGIQGSIYLGCMYSAEGAFFASHSMGKTNLQCPEYSEIPGISGADSSVDNSITIVEPVIHENKIGTLVVFSGLDVLRDKNLTLLLTLIATTFLAGGAAFFLATYLKSIITGPIQALRQTMQRVESTQDYSIRAQRIHNDELGDLTYNFNLMLEKIQSDNEALKRSEERFRSLSESSPVGIFLSDSSGNIVYTNEQWRKIIGLDVDEDSNNWLQRARSQDADSVASAWSKAVNNAKNFDVEFYFQGKQNRKVSAVCHAREMCNDQNEFQGHVGSLLDISDLKQAQRQLEKLALYDPLTQIANRTLLKDRLGKAIEYAKRHDIKIGLIFLDIDNFKRINDTVGHDAGDQLLKIVATRIKSCVRKVDTVARFGGDEFVILVDDVKDHNITNDIANKLIRRISAPARVGQHDLVVTTSIGITEAPTDGDTVSILMKNADLAMYRSKSAGKNTFQYYSQDMNLEMLRKVRLEKELRAAIENQEFVAVYQSKYECQNNKISGFESLLRWRNPIRGWMSPEEFIPVAEETGLINMIGDWVIQKVCCDTVRLTKEGKLPIDGRVAINLSVKQFRNANFLNRFIEIIEFTKVNPKNLEVEITETIFMEDFTHTVQLLSKLKKLGLTISIDDFGTGYSSLSYLKKLPIDCLKVDKSFINGIPEDGYDIEITSAIIVMAHKLGLSVVAEGVETQAQLRFLKENRCDYVQGFYFSKGKTLENIISPFVAG